jgi:RNA-directed DNA polymerase
MRTETTIKAMDSIALASKKGRRVNGLFRLLTNPEVLWRQAYANIYSNKGAITKGVNQNTLDGFSEERVNQLIGMLVNRQYCPKPVRRTYIPKKNGKMRPLGIPTGDDKLVQEVVRMILEQIYEPIFSEKSHGFRTGKSCHTALRQVVKSWSGVKWIIEFDIKGFFDNISHTKLVEILKKRIDDKRLIDLIRKMLKAGYLEEWKYNSTWSGTPQGGVISPILANIYLHELDRFIEEKICVFNKGKRRKPNPEHAGLIRKMWKTNTKLRQFAEARNDGAPPNSERQELLRNRSEIQKQMHQIPSKDHYDPDFRRLKYMRYADDFIIGVIGSRAEAESTMDQVKEFVEQELLLELADDKTCIRRAKEGVRFLGYDLKVCSTSPKLLKVAAGRGTCICRTTSEVMQLHVPSEKVYQYASKKGYGDMACFRPVSRPELIQRSEVEILLTYNAEMRGFANYYSLAQGYKKSLHKLIALANQSLFATLGNKHHSDMAKIARKMRLPNQGGYGLRVTADGKAKLYKVFKLKDHVLPYAGSNDIDEQWSTAKFTMWRTELIQRLNANRCEYCGKEGESMQVHHVKALKDIKEGKQLWQKMMSAMNRKTMVLCIECHKELHSRGLPDWKAKVRKHP